MLAAARTRLLDRGMAQMSAFFACEILLAGATVPLACVGTTLSATGLELSQRGAGTVRDLDMLFRIESSLFTARPDLGITFQWRRTGETTYRETLRLAAIKDPTGDTRYLLTGESPTKG